VVCANEKTPQHENNNVVAKWKVRFIKVSFLSAPDEQTPNSDGFFYWLLREGNFGRIVPQNSLTPKHGVEFSHDWCVKLQHKWATKPAEFSHSCNLQRIRFAGAEL